MTSGRTAIIVVAGVIEDGDRLLVTRRMDDTHLAGFWEFPGGKCDPGESHEQCLRRELREELDVAATVGPELLTTEHAYPDRTVRLHFRHCTLTGTPRPVLGQEMKWVRRDGLDALEFPEADKELIRFLMTGGGKHLG